MIVYRKFSKFDFASEPSKFQYYAKTIPIPSALLLKNEKGFTLAETMITLTILGIVAAIVVPSLARSYIDKTNKAKIRKAMAAYEKLMPKVVLENQISTNNGLRNFAQSCLNMKQEFKVAQNGSNDCVFKTGDGVWWTVRLDNYGNEGIWAFVGLKEANIQFVDDAIMGGLSSIDFSNEPVFKFTTSFEDNILRVNDKNFRLYDYISGSLKISYNKRLENWDITSDYCNSAGESTSICNNINGSENGSSYSLCIGSICWSTYPAFCQSNYTQSICENNYCTWYSCYGSGSDAYRALCNNSPLDPRCNSYNSYNISSSSSSYSSSSSSSYSSSLSSSCQSAYSDYYVISSCDSIGCYTQGFNSIYDCYSYYTVSYDKNYYSYYSSSSSSYYSGSYSSYSSSSSSSYSSGSYSS